MMRHNRMRFAILTSFAVMLCLTSAPTRAVDGPEPPSETALAPFAEKGSHFVEGYVHITTKLFGATTFANAAVYLVPNSDYATWFVKRVGENLEKGVQQPIIYPANLARFSRQTQSDSVGHFIFRDVPPGRYLVVSNVKRTAVDTPERERTQTAVDSNGDLVNVALRTHGTIITSEADELAASAEVGSDRGGVHIDGFDIVGANVCCHAHT